MTRTLDLHAVSFPAEARAVRADPGRAWAACGEISGPGDGRGLPGGALRGTGEVAWAGC
ncbi:hypothetical protein [Sphaerimonospora mesophila]|uniref:hypothetical protein n=1 Tax=Sphaerimonospora mesophila TaxID=37483 RepID=UPI001365941B